MDEHLTLYRKYRPSTFDEVVGQEHVTVTIRNAIKAGKVAHAYLFSGPRGTGKTTIARLIAKGLDCAHGPTDTPCGECDACAGIQRGSYLDVIEIDAASNRGIDDIRSLREHVRFAPALGGWKVYIIDEVHMLTADASNALLKTLEEPPNRTVFVLATTEKHKVLPTIQSRCQVFDFRRLPVNLIVERLRAVCEAEGIVADEKSLLLIARKARGGLRDALVLLEQARSFAAVASDRSDGNGALAIDADTVYRLIGYLPDTTIAGMLGAIAKGNVFAALETLRELDDAGYELKTLPPLLQHAIIQTLVFKRTGSYFPDWVLERESTEELASALSEPDMLRLVDLLDEADRTMRFGEDPLLALEVAFLRHHATVATAPEAPATGPAPSLASAGATPAAAAAERAAREATPGDRARLKERWKQLLDTPRLKERIVLHYHLTEAIPLSLEGGTLAIRFKKTVADSYREALDGEAVAFVNSLLPRFFGQGTTLRVVDDDTGVAARPPGPAAEGGPEAVEGPRPAAAVPFAEPAGEPGATAVETGATAQDGGEPVVPASGDTGPAPVSVEEAAAEVAREFGGVIDPEL